MKVWTDKDGFHLDLRVGWSTNSASMQLGESKKNQILTFLSLSYLIVFLQLQNIWVFSVFGGFKNINQEKKKNLPVVLSEGSKDGTEIDATHKHFFLDIISYHEKYKKLKS